MRSLVFDSADLGAIEVFLNDAYTTMSIGNGGERGVAARIRRAVLGPVSLDRLDFGFEMEYDADPLEKVCLCAVQAGTVEASDGGGDANVFGAGEIGLLTAPELPYRGMVRSARCSITMFDPALFTRFGDPGELGKPIRFAGHRPITPAAGRRLSRAVEHLQQVASEPGAGDLVAGTLGDYLAATVLDTMPTTVVIEPTATDRRDAQPDMVRRAVAHMESHLREDLSVSDIAAVSYVTVRALQLAFRKHLGTTPLAHLRRLRLDAAHTQLRAAVAGDRATVTAIASEWGFTHAGRFAIAYKRVYGVHPSHTLQS